MKCVVASQLICAVRKVSLRSTSLKCNSLSLACRPSPVLWDPCHTPTIPNAWINSTHPSDCYIHVAFPRRGLLQVRHFSLCFLNTSRPVTPTCSLFWLLLQTENSWRAGTIFDCEPWNPRTTCRMLSDPGKNHKAGSRLSKV